MSIHASPLGDPSTRVYSPLRNPFFYLSIFATPIHNTYDFIILKTRKPDRTLFTVETQPSFFNPSHTFLCRTHLSVFGVPPSRSARPQIHGNRGQLRYSHKPHSRMRAVNIGSPSHLRGVWASPAPRREAPRNDWGNVLLACTCVTSHATYKKSGYGWNPYPLGLFDLRHPYPLSQKARKYLSSRRYSVFGILFGILFAL